jgi:hypothetical protein
MSRRIGLLRQAWKNALEIKIPYFVEVIMKGLKK